MQELNYERPATVAEAFELLREDGARALAGGTDLIPQLREGRRQARMVVDLKKIPELSAISRLADGGWRLGGAASVRALGGHAGLAAEHGPLLESARLIGSLQIQSRASLGGNLCNAAPSADAVPLLISLGAKVEVAGPAGSREMAVDDVATAPGRTKLAPGEIISAILLGAKPPRSAARYLRFTPRREMDIAIAGSGVAITLDAAGHIASARITLASVAPTPLRASAAESLLIGARPKLAAFAAAGAQAASEASPISDTRGSADYRRELIAVLTRRALADCARQLGVELA